MPADVYWDKAIVNGGGVPCGACADAIEVGWEATAPRDPDDPALSNDNVAGVAWYHTSTFAEWPSPGYGEVVGAQLRQFASTMPATEFARMVKREQTKALHVGTYESAIENMLRRMYDQNDANSDFYLHRVALRLPDTAIPDGYRHESHEDASDLTLDDLGEFLAVRYSQRPGSTRLLFPRHPPRRDRQHPNTRSPPRDADTDTTAPCHRRNQRPRRGAGSCPRSDARHCRHRPDSTQDAVSHREEKRGRACDAHQRAKP